MECLRGKGEESREKTVEKSEEAGGGRQSTRYKCESIWTNNQSGRQAGRQEGSGADRQYVGQPQVHKQPKQGKGE